MSDPVEHGYKVVKQDGGAGGWSVLYLEPGKAPVEVAKVYSRDEAERAVQGHVRERGDRKAKGEVWFDSHGNLIRQGEAGC